MTKKITLRNWQHGTEHTVVVDNNVLTHAQYLKAEKALCGNENCRCGVVNGLQDGMGKFDLDTNYRQIYRLVDWS